MSEDEYDDLEVSEQVVNSLKRNHIFGDLQELTDNDNSIKNHSGVKKLRSRSMRHI